MAPAASYDYIVVGAGSTGCTLARRLSDDGNATVLLLEAGPRDDHPNIHDSYIPDIYNVWNAPRYTRNYATERADDSPAWPEISRGVVRGGTSAINGMIYIRGNPRDFDRWGRESPGWSYNDVLPLFKHSECYEGGADEHHGADGPLHVRRMVEPSPVAHAFCDAAVELGYDGPDHDFNGARQEGGAGLYQVTVTPDGKRSSTSVAFLDPVAGSRPNLVEMTDTLVREVTFAGDRATGVRAVQGGVEQEWTANREVILCAGAFESPKLLMLSGVGPEAQLEAHGIKTRVPLEGVGENLQDHLLLLMYWRTSLWGQRARFIAEAGLFTHTHTQPKEESPNLQYHFCAGLPGFEPVPGGPPNFIVCPTLAQPRSRGSVSLLSADPRHPPRVDPCYLSSAEDVAVLREGVKLARDLVSQPAFSELAMGELWAGEPPRDDDAVDAFIRATARTVWHPVGTCRMGAGDDAVVDARLRVRGARSLRVADASIMPAITAGNTNAACIMIGEKAADLIKEDHP